MTQICTGYCHYTASFHWWYVAVDMKGGHINVMKIHSIFIRPITTKTCSIQFLLIFGRYFKRGKLLMEYVFPVHLRYYSLLPFTAIYFSASVS